MKKSKYILISLTAIALTASLLAACFVRIGFHQQPESDEGNTKVLGLLNADTEKEPETEPAPKSILTDAAWKQAEGMITRYLSAGDFDGLDSYLQNMIAGYEESDSGKHLLKAVSLREDLAKISSLDANTAALMRTFRNPELLAAALVYAPISCKYTAVQDLDSFMVPPPDTEGQINIQEISLTDTERQAWFQRINQNPDHTYADVKMYSVQNYGAEFHLVLAYVISTDTWEPYLIDSVDERVPKVFQTALQLQSAKDQGLISEQTMDTGLIYENLNEMDFSIFD